MTYHIAICNDDSRDAGYVSELLHQWAQLRGCAVTEHRFPSAEGFLFRYEEDRSFDRLKRDCQKSLAEFAARRPRIRFDPFFAAACTSRKILCAERVCFHAFYA